MKIVITRNVFIGGKLFQANSTPVELPDADAKQLVALEKAVKVADPAVAAETPAPAAIDSAPVDPAVTDAAEKPKKK